MSTNDHPELVTLEQSAVETDCSVQTIRRRIRDGTLRAVRWRGRLRVYREDLARLMEPQEVAR